MLRIYGPAWRSGARPAGAPLTCVDGMVDKRPRKDVDLLGVLGVPFVIAGDTTMTPVPAPQA